MGYESIRSNITTSAVLLVILLFLSSFTSVLASQNDRGLPLMRVGHRGAPAYAPENTLPSFEKAIELGATHIELDVHLTRDGSIVVMHDIRVDRTTNGTGLISDLSLAKIKRFDAGGWFSPHFTGETVPTLEEALSLLKLFPSVDAIIEFKGNSQKRYPGIQEKTIASIRELGLSHRVILKSFNADDLKNLERIAPEMRQLHVYLLGSELPSLTISTGISLSSPLNISSELLQPHRLGLTSRFVAKAHRRGFKVIAWGVETAAQMNRMLDIGVDGIETDHLDLLTATISGRP